MTKFKPTRDWSSTQVIMALDNMVAKGELECKLINGVKNYRLTKLGEQRKRERKLKRDSIGGGRIECITPAITPAITPTPRAISHDPEV